MEVSETIFSVSPLWQRGERGDFMTHNLPDILCLSMDIGTVSPVILRDTENRERK